MNSGAFLTSAANIGLIVCAAIDTTAAVSYAVRARGGVHGKWWTTVVGRHLMAFMAAFAIVLDMSAVYLLTSGQVLVHAAPVRTDWFMWMRIVSFDTLIPFVLGWRLLLILRPPKR